MSANENEIVLLLHMSSALYGVPCRPFPDFEQVNIQRLLSLAILNGMGYYIVKKLCLDYPDKLDKTTLSMVKDIEKRGDDRYNHIEKTIGTLNSCLNDYLLIKTHRTHVRIANDLDVLVRDFDGARTALLRAGMNMSEYNNKEQRAIFYYQGLTKIHLHGDISWGKEGTVFVDEELIWDKPRTASYGQKHVKIPNVNADFLIHLAHINFENLHITMSDLLYLYNLASQVNWYVVSKQATKNHWGGTLRRSVQLLDTIHHTIYQGPCPFGMGKLKHRQIRNLKSITFPISISRKHIILAWIEKKLVLWALRNRIPRIIHILLFRDTRRGFSPPEMEQIIEKEH